ncbi:hypothetical protein AR457_10045 [Streptomyces agglomeratus]|uniref:DUF7489 domain-containing protein n=1 Tax=Streptomyces agglomeratus TaxID=285458 RepID=UPI000854BB67|nr:hypothetical protein [Streptomyces agglomeratus]OEJ41230.1 hypothetical protein BGK70_26610 [Streptomyces agglomeratus]OEJ44392.1 hypothetical protein AR457_10045 [Streptomyces agglomeratus]
MWIFLVLALLPLVMVLWGLAGQVNREVDSQYVGEVIARFKRDVTLTTGMRHDSLLTVRADSSQEFTVQVSPEVYDLFAVGDRIVKLPGARWPTKAE